MAENTENELSEVKDFQKGFLTLPFEGENLRDFIAGLLGTPQTIKKRIKGVFQVELKDLQNFHDLIEQRISQQNNGKLIQLKTEVYYNDDSSVILNSYEQLVAYNEAKPIISEAVRLTWTYLIQFANKKVPEKQQIELMIISTPERNVVEDDDIPVMYPTLGQFRINIEHTDRTWGGDIENIISNQINSIIQPRTTWKKLCKQKNGSIGVSVGLLFLISSLVSIYVRTRGFNISEITKVKEFIKTTETSSSKLDFTLEYLATNAQDLFFLKSQLFIVVSFLLAVILGVWVSSLANMKEKSFLVLTRTAKTNRDVQLKKSKKKTTWFFVSIAVSIVVGVISNYIFGFITGTI